MKQRRKQPRAFALVIVLLIGVAALAVAVGIAAATGNHTNAEQRSIGADEANSLAQSGMERTEAWVAEIAKTDVDFDRALDPGLVANGSGATAASCDFTANPPVTPGSETGVPKFTDGSIFSSASFMNGASYRLVPYGGGAYLVHTEDNDDDTNSDPKLINSTDNDQGTKGAGPKFCGEGATIGGANNPVRDRDRAIWLTSVGIWPGTDPNVATHRVVMRKLVISPAAPAGAAAFQVGGDVNGNVGGNNAFGSVQVGGNNNSSGGFCGSVVTHLATNDAVANPACVVANPFSNSTGATLAAVTPPAPDDKQFYDWTTSCSLYWRDDFGLFFWDSQATRGGVTCSAYAGNLVPPDKDPSHGFAACWAPILLPATGDPNQMLGYDPFENAVDQVERGGAVPRTDFRPEAGVTINYSDLGGGYNPAIHANNLAGAPTFIGWYSSPAIVHLPDWASCNNSGAGSPATVKWNPPITGASIGCSQCTGSNATFQVGSGPSGLQFLGPSSGGVAAAYPTSILFIDGNWDNTVTFGPVPASQSAAGWPMVTVAVNGDMHFPNNNDVPFGVGTARGGYPSLIVRNQLDGGAGNSTIGTAGGLIVGGDLRIKKELDAFGPIMVRNQIQQGPGGAGISWTYSVDMLGTGAAGPPPVPPIVAYPVNF
ncbi:MAG TPA: hypothetical protein VGO62_14610 [Myxococcota bacterium]